MSQGCILLIIQYRQTFKTKPADINHIQCQVTTRQLCTIGHGTGIGCLFQAGVI